MGLAVAFPRGGSSSTVSRSNWNLEVLVFDERGTRSTRRKTSRSRVENQQQTQPTYDAGSGNRTGTHWWEASALTTAPTLLPEKNQSLFFFCLCFITVQ